jgi:hypothetical protein
MNPENQNIEKWKSQTDNNPTVRFAKLRGMLGQMNTLLMWKDDKDEYREAYLKLINDKEVKARFDSLRNQMIAVLNNVQDSEVNMEAYEKLSLEWDEILNMVFKKKQ